VKAKLEIVGMTYTKYRLRERVCDEGDPLLFIIEGLKFDDYLQISTWKHIYKTTDANLAHVAWYYINKFKGHENIAKEYTPDE